MEKCILLISFYNQKALGVRYLEKTLKKKGCPVHIIFFKGFNSANPCCPTVEEMDLLKKTISCIGPSLIGLSVMSSLYLEAVYMVNHMIRENFQIPIVWGGVYASLFPEECLNHADFIIRGEGEHALAELADSIFSQKPFYSIPNLVYKEDASIRINPVSPLLENLDELGYPQLDGSNKYFIENDALSDTDPVYSSISYELSTSRGCPFMCSYCSCVNLRRLYKNQGSFVRFRSVENVISELKEAKSLMKNLKYIHFWDEIFPDDESWIHSFVLQYQKEIHLPFEIWCHPLKVKKKTLEKLVSAGLYKVVMGIQSGSERVRKEIFHRTEKNEDIIHASKILSQCKVPQVIYDFILRHPFETVDDLKETYTLCTKLAPPFELQLHGLNFLPGTDISDMALKMGILTPEELNKIMYSPMKEQYNRYWGNGQKNLLSDFWYALIYMSQYLLLRPAVKYLASNSSSLLHMKTAAGFHKCLIPLGKTRYYYKKCSLILRSYHIRSKYLLPSLFHSGKETQKPSDKGF
ncbi:MAG: B12-binding domain-containing radical SAM protein [Clostridia bacterium]|nr:B12-binding domain-containing radical SAM protein [Clostridia bacterium]